MEILGSHYWILSHSGITYPILNNTKLALKRNSTIICSTMNAAMTSEEYKLCRTSENSQQTKLPHCYEYSRMDMVSVINVPHSLRHLNT